ncbi:Uncharacterised protein [Burkholderia pseudomallei]|nr:Uncharacterised protein [Burkholderia pseudomallei]
MSMSALALALALALASALASALVTTSARAARSVPCAAGSARIARASSAVHAPSVGVRASASNASAWPMRLKRVCMYIRRMESTP